ncbi:MAG: hypothetical protein RSB41_03105 [Bacilli bacterium]
MNNIGKSNIEQLRLQKESAIVSFITTMENIYGLKANTTKILNEKVYTSVLKMNDVSFIVGKISSVLLAYGIQKEEISEFIDKHLELMELKPDVMELDLAIYNNFGNLPEVLQSNFEVLHDHDGFKKYTPETLYGVASFHSRMKNLPETIESYYSHVKDDNFNRAKRIAVSFPLTREEAKNMIKKFNQDMTLLKKINDPSLKLK